jgi:hypothetical protein
MDATTKWIWAALLPVALSCGACGEDKDEAAPPASAEGAATTAGAVTADASVAETKTEAAATTLVATLQADQDTQSFLGGTDPGDGEATGPCYTVTRKSIPPTLLFSFTGAEGCSISKGEIEVSRKGPPTKRFTLARLGSATSPVVVRGVEFSGFLRLDGQAQGAADFATCNADGDPLAEVCTGSSSACLEVCAPPVGQGGCSTETRGQLGLTGTAKFATSGELVTVAIDGSGSYFSAALAQSAQQIRVGAKAEDVCAGQGFSVASSVVFALPESGGPPACVCPTSGVASSSGSLQVSVGVDCPSDSDTDANFSVLLILDDARTEYEFQSACAEPKTSTCSGGSARIAYQDVNLASCGLTACTPATQQTLGCNSGCTSCSSPGSGVPLSALSAGAQGSTFLAGLSQSLEAEAAGASALLGATMREACSTK